MTNRFRDRFPPGRLVFLVLALLACRADAQEAPRYNRDIRPILAENCFACHGPDKSARKGGLRLDIREDAVKTGAITPGKPDESSVVERIFTKDARKVMPPAKAHKTLTPAQKDLLRRWIAAGAEYEAHWAFLAPTRPPLPRVKGVSKVRNPVDSFLLAELERKGLTFSDEADRRTLARRVSLDLTGLPPRPADVEAFVADTRPQAYERFVDKMLSSPFWGEHRGRYWLDAARYGDTHGIHFDNFREMWSFRDWVISAFNRNQSFDEFTIEQLAGDLLPNRTMDQQIASGFNRCNITTNEGGVIRDEYFVLYTRDRTETVSQVWMALTAGCATCHDHKLDPITQREFYQMAAFFNNSTQDAMDGNIKDTPPIITVPAPPDRPRYNALVKEISDARTKVQARKASARTEFDKRLKSGKTNELAIELPSQNLHLHAPLSEGKGSKFAITQGDKKSELTRKAAAGWDAGHVADKAFVAARGEVVELPNVGDFEHNQAFTAAVWIWLPRNGPSGAVIGRMDEGDDFRGWDLWMENGKFGAHIVHKWPFNAIKVISAAAVKAGTWNHVAISYDGKGKAAGLKIFLNGVLQTARVVSADSLTATIRTKVPMKLAQRNNSSRIEGLRLQELRIYDRALSDSETIALARGSRAAYLLARPGQLKPAETNELFDTWLGAGDKEFRESMAAQTKLEQEEQAIKARGTIAHVTNEKMEEPAAHILFRGDYDKKRDRVTAATFNVLPPMAKELPRNRLGFAKWLVQPEHPLTARVTVNRFWQEVFGTGIVRTSGDFGIAGDLPSHPELLDWLAVEFRETGWDVKQLFRTLVTSAAYRQSAVTTAQHREKDPFNTLLSRGPRFRMDAEMVRDHALAASGLLVHRLGGPSVKPYMPEGVWEAVGMIGSNTRDYRADKGENLYRRGMYTFWKRAAPPASLEIFNAPNREYCTVRRERTNTPLMALVTLNDPTYVEAARHLAERAIKEGGRTDAERIDYMGRRLIARPFRTEEHTVIAGMLRELLAEYRLQPAEATKLVTVGESRADPTLDVPTLAGWTMLANSLMNLDEVLNK